MKKERKYKYAIKVMSDHPAIIGIVMTYMANSGFLLREDTNVEMMLKPKRKKK